MLNLNCRSFIPKRLNHNLYHYNNYIHTDHYPNNLEENDLNFSEDSEYSSLEYLLSISRLSNSNDKELENEDKKMTLIEFKKKI